MAEILDYIAWRGDLSFDNAPFNDVDNYILSKISTPDFTDIIPERGSYITVQEAVKRYMSLRKDSDSSLGPLSSSSLIPMLNAISTSRRFANLMLTDFSRIVEADNTEQFAAITIMLPSGDKYIAFRGTDDTIVAWKENFMMAVSDSVAAQNDALNYLIDAVGDEECKIYVGGHSKGGNLAVYAAALANKQIQDRIICVYNNDGPGFRSNFYTNEGYIYIAPKIKTIVSQNAIVGTLLEQNTPLTVVKSTKSGIAAHDGFTWEVLGDNFISCPGLSRMSEAFDAAIGSTLESMTDDEKKLFINEFFDALTSAGAENLSDFSLRNLKRVLETAKSVSSNNEVQHFLLKVMELMVKEYRTLL